MASSQPTSPVRSPSPDRFELSPNSKLKKLLAGVDSDSDEDNARTPKEKETSSFARRASPTASDRSNDATERDSGDGIVQPRGRIASRMHTAQGDARARVRDMLQKSNAKQGRPGSADVEMADSASTGAQESDSENDIIRPRGRLASRMQGGAQVTEQSARSDVGESTAGQSSGDVEDTEMVDGGVSVRPRHIRQRQRRTKTPESNVASPHRESSSGLFVTPSKSPMSAQPLSQAEDSGSDADVPVLKSNRFQALVEKKRNERLAREAEEARKREARAAAAEELGDDNDDDVSDISDDEGGRKLTQTQKAKTRPSRQASKKALEEMNRETQRMQRAMQLAHEAKTKKRITKATLFERFNFNPDGNAAKEKLQSSSRPQSPTSAKSTDAEMRDQDTPPSSPPARVEDVLGKDLGGLQSQAATHVPQTTTAGPKQQAEENGDDFSDLMDMQAFARKPVDKGKGKAETPEFDTKRSSKRRVQIKLPPMQANRVDLGSGSNQDSGDDDDLIILDQKRSKLDALFDRAPKDKTKESRSLYALRQLAHLNSPERKAHKKTDKAAMTPGELQAFLNQRARDQARAEKERRMEMLKAKGIHIQTEEERERDREQIEDMVARARREAEEIMAREREDAKKEKRSSGKADPLAWDDSGSDDDYEEGESQGNAEVELSGSEEELEEDENIVDGDAVDGDNDDAGEQDRANQDSAARPFADEDAEEDIASEASSEASSGPSFVDPDEEEERHRWGASDEEADEAPAFVQARRPKKATAIVPDEETEISAPVRARRPKRPTAIISDDEADSDVEATPKPKTNPATMTPAPKSKVVAITPAPNTTSPELPKSVLRSANKTFIPGLPVNEGGPAGLGLTQIFAGTMDSQTAPFGNSPSQPMPTFDNFPDSQFSQKATDSAEGMVLDSQPVPATQQDGTQAGDEPQIQFNFTQSQTHGLDSLLRDDIMTQASDLIDPTQDDGFQDWTPLKERFVEPPPATADTVAHDASQAADLSHQSPLVQKRGRLIRKAAVALDSEEESDGAGSIIKPSAFNVLQDAALKQKKRKAREDFIKKKSKAKEMVEEQAEESEDEYAGLGGVDGEDSDDDDAASIHEMIDDQTQNNQADGVALAKFYA
jgi:mediator of replication checkpoint protein 1